MQMYYNVSGVRMTRRSTALGATTCCAKGMTCPASEPPPPHRRRGRVAAVAAAGSPPKAKAKGAVLLAAGHLADGSSGGALLAIDPSDGNVTLIANTSVPPDTGVGMAFDGMSLYYEGWDDVAGRNTFVTTFIRTFGKSNSISMPRDDNVFNFEFDATGKLFALSATQGNLSVGGVDSMTGNFTAAAAVDSALGVELLSGSTFEPAGPPGSGLEGGTFVLLSRRKGSAQPACVIVSASLDPKVPTVLSPPVQGLLGPVLLSSIALLPGPSGSPGWNSVVGIGQSVAQPSQFVVVRVHRATGMPVAPPLLLFPGPPDGATIEPIYALDAEKRLLHQIFSRAGCSLAVPATATATTVVRAGGGCPVCLLSVDIDTGKHGECVALPTDYVFLTILEKVVTL